MTRLLDRIAWLVFLYSPAHGWLERISGRRIADATNKRRFRP